MQDYNIWPDCCAFLVLLVLISVYLIRRSVRIFQNNIFFAMLVCQTAATLADVLSVTGEGKKAAVVMLMKSLTVLLDVASAFLFALYVTAYITYHVQWKQVIKQMIAPLAAVAAALLVNAFTGVFFSAKGAYFEQEPLFALFFMIQMGYLVYGILLMYRLRTRLTREKLLMMMPFAVLMFFSGALQYMLPSILLQHFIAALMSVSLFFGLLNPDELYDRESGLFNAAAFASHMEKRMRSKNSCQLIAVGIRDMDLIRESLGKEESGALSEEIIRFLKGYEDNALVFRLEQDIFCIVPDGDDLKGAEKIEDEVVNRFRLPFLQGSYELEVGSVCCLIEAPRDAGNREEIMGIIRLAFRTGVQKGLNVVGIGDLDIRHESYMKEIDEKVRNAIRDHKLEVFYQPIYSTKDKKFVAAEALLRMHDDDHGFVSPAVFIPVAEANGSIVEIDSFVMESVCRMISENDFDKLGLHYIEVNLSPADCMQDNLVWKVKKMLFDHHVSPARLNLEITETASDSLTQLVDDNVRALHEIGIRFSLDDFGTGYSSLSRILQLPLSIIKIDKSILQPVFDERLSEAERKNARLMLESCVDMIKRIGGEIVTEGVETAEQAEEVIRLGCDYIQGFYYSKPLPEELFLQTIAGSR